MNDNRGSPADWSIMTGKTMQFCPVLTIFSVEEYYTALGPGPTPVPALAPMEEEEESEAEEEEEQQWGGSQQW